jgi:hypothetical protein
MILVVLLHGEGCLLVGVVVRDFWFYLLMVLVLLPHGAGEFW